MADIVKMPKMSDTMTEGVMAKWHKKVGDKVKSGDVLAEVETDKASVEVPSPVSGTITELLFKENDAIKTGDVIFTCETN